MFMKSLGDFMVSFTGSHLSKKNKLSATAMVQSLFQVEYVGACEAYILLVVIFIMMSSGVSTIVIK